MKRILIDVLYDMMRIALVVDGRVDEIIYDNGDGSRIVGNIYCGRVMNVLPGMHAAFIDIGVGKNGYLYYSGEKPYVGKEIIVKVEKDAAGTKGAVLTDKVSFPGKFIVLLPNTNDIGISKKITSATERNRVKEILNQILPNDYGAIVRTEGEGKTAQEFKDEIERLLNISNNVFNKGKYYSAPALIYKDNLSPVKALRELFSHDIDELVINNKAEYERLITAAEEMKIDTSKIKTYYGDVPLFEKYYIESQVSKAFEKKVWLKSGGFIIIEETEACVVIDVNTGKYTGKKDLQKTFLKTNLEAAEEIAHQLRLRNLSGMIIVDFIDMLDEEDRKLLRSTLEKAVKNDRHQTVVVGMTELGLMQITRKKTSPSILKQLTHKCKHCSGTGRVVSIHWIVASMKQDINKILSKLPPFKNSITISANQSLLSLFSGNNNEYKNFIEKKFSIRVILEQCEDMPYGKYEVRT